MKPFKFWFGQTVVRVTADMDLAAIRQIAAEREQVIQVNGKLRLTAAAPSGADNRQQPRHGKC